MSYFGNRKTPGRTSALLAALTTLSVAACSGPAEQAPAPVTAPPPPAPATPVASAAPGAPAAATAAAPAPAPALPPPVLVKDAGLKTPESVLYDADQDVYFVSNINGKPADLDKNGFISKVSPDGNVLELKWIDGSKPNTTLHAPKGMALSGDLLFVTDVNSIKLFDRKTGAPRGKIGTPGATFLNDLAVAPDGTIYASDSGLTAKGDELVPSGSDTIYKIGKRREAEVLLRSKDLNRPNGLLADENGVWVVTFGANELYYVNKDKKAKEQVQQLPTGALDGVFRLPDGSLLVSSWEGSTVYRGKPGESFQPFATGLEAPADVAYDSKRHRLLVPRFKADMVEFHALAPVAPAPRTAATPTPATPANAATPNTQSKPAAGGAAPQAPATAAPGAATSPAKAGSAPAGAAPSAPAAGNPAPSARVPVSALPPSSNAPGNPAPTARVPAPAAPAPAPKGAAAPAAPAK